MTAIGTAFILSLSLTVLATLAVARGRCDALERRVFAAMRIASPLRPDGKPTRLVTALRDLAALGGDMLRTLVLAACLAVLLLAGEARVAGELLGCYAAVRLGLIGIKRIVRRRRPEALAGAPAVYTSSFPSGHTLMTVVLYLSLALLLPPGAAPVAPVAVPLALSAGAAVGVSRILLGLHWPSDVIVGWLAGVALVSGYVLLLGAVAR